MNRKSAVIAVLIYCAGAAAQPPAAVSRFAESAEGWTVQGPGQLTWIPAGFLQVTRIGPGELYLVAPPTFHGEWGPQQQFNVPRVSLNYLRPAVIDRTLAAELTGPAGTANGETASIIWCGATPWIPISPRYWNVTGSWPTTVTGVRIRIDLSTADPVGEVFQLDDISLRRCMANCDDSTVPPILNVNDFICFMNAHAGRDPYANFEYFDNCLDVRDYIGFLNSYGAGCQ